MILRTTAARVGMWIVRHRNTFAALLALAAAGCMALSAYHFRPQALSRIHYRPTAGGPQDYYDPSAPWWAFTGALLIVLALVFACHTPRAPQRTGRSFGTPRSRWLRVLILPGVLALFALAESNGHWIGLDRLWDRSPVEQLALFGVGFALVVIGLGGLPGRISSVRGVGEPPPGEAVPVGAIHEGSTRKSVKKVQP